MAAGTATPGSPPGPCPEGAQRSASPQPCSTLTHSGAGNTGHGAGGTGQASAARVTQAALPTGTFGAAPSTSSWGSIGFCGTSLPSTRMFLFFFRLDAYSNAALTKGSLLLPLPRTNTDESPSHAFCLLNLFSTSLSTITYLAGGLKSKLQLRLSEGPSGAQFPYPGCFFSADAAGQTRQGAQ